MPPMILFLIQSENLVLPFPIEKAVQMTPWHFTLGTSIGAELHSEGFAAPRVRPLYSSQGTY
jgi:hypothetical protein